MCDWEKKSINFSMNKTLINTPQRTLYKKLMYSLID